MKRIKSKLKCVLILPILTFINIAPVQAAPPTPFGGGNNGVHISHSSAISTNIDGYNSRSHHVQISGTNFHTNINFLVEQSPYNQGDRIGTLRVERLNRNIAVFEGEAMRNMDVPPR